jgi:pilus assembly protein Flp/PilA
MASLVKRFARDESGQDLIEYGLLAGTISVVALAVFDSVGTSLNDFYTKIRLGIFS